MILESESLVMCGEGVRHPTSKRENEEEGRGFKEYKTKKVRLNL